MEQLGVVDKKWMPIWEESCRFIKTYLSRQGCNKSGSLLAHIYWRLGRECGIICKTLANNNISWGTYEDPIGFHCNAHLNNLVLLPQGGSLLEDKKKTVSSLLAPLDFDMAFIKESFTRDQNTWNEWMTLEKNGMKMVIAGDAETSTGVTTSAKLTKGFQLLKTALRDTMLLAYNDAVNNIPDKHPPLPDKEDALHALLKLALIITEHETA
eukprot:TRINITY_DN5553_c0_g1_i1.p1 TRINITY_DN5553_c0_g1~~TRINITY_DN5553_c0_g1_i1.p1  ORF type:complete len:234 (+),score=46.04 TRINITY_DN5553_c0_g1_i1:72-704(+)